MQITVTNWTPTLLTQLDATSARWLSGDKPSAFEEEARELFHDKMYIAQVQGTKLTYVEEDTYEKEDEVEFVLVSNEEFINNFGEEKPTTHLVLGERDVVETLKELQKELPHLTWRSGEKLLDQTTLDVVLEDEVTLLVHEGGTIAYSDLDPYYVRLLLAMSNEEYEVLESLEEFIHTINPYNQLH